MNQIEAMKQALEALEDYKGRRAKDILRQAIEQAEKAEPVAIFDVAVNDEIAAVWYDCANGTLKNGDKLYTTPPTAPIAQQPASHPACPSCNGDVLYECVFCGSNNYPSAQKGVGTAAPTTPGVLKLVPVEPTEEMMQEGYRHVASYGALRKAYKAMLFAASTAPAQGLFVDMISQHEGLAEELAASVQQPLTYDKTEMNAFVQNLYNKKMLQGKHGHYESMFSVVHTAIYRIFRKETK